MRPFAIACLSAALLVGACRSEPGRRAAVVFDAALASVKKAPSRVEGQARHSKVEAKLRPASATESANDPPKGYVAVTATARSGHAFGNAVLLFEPNDEIFVPIFIGGTEALSIQLRLAKRQYRRPLTHDLFDSVMKKLGAKMVRAQVDGLRENIYVGTIVLKAGKKLFEVDARPSDAIALAIGNKVPIYVSKVLINKAGIRLSDIEKARPPKEVAPIAL